MQVARRETQAEYEAFPQPSHCTMREGEPRQGRVVPPILPDAPVPGTPDKIGSPTRRRAGRLRRSLTRSAPA
ncbi:hypothetical protein [Acetobacter lambici]|uniref:hypothetical protein n=1 Tax=Acetobacter lambici TaxID=1332824 RepID=UPI0020A587DF|nr:hypothetical protein [Acetobacter lambici]MCP1243153.1 hypothetical protein [Acetobacter lambici]